MRDSQHCLQLWLRFGSLHLITSILMNEEQSSTVTCDWIDLDQLMDQFAVQLDYQLVNQYVDRLKVNS